VARPDGVAGSVNLEAGEAVPALGIAVRAEDSPFVARVNVGAGGVDPVDLNRGLSEDDEFGHACNVRQAAAVAPEEGVAELRPGEGVLAVGARLPVFIVGLEICVRGVGHPGRLHEGKSIAILPGEVLRDVGVAGGPHQVVVRGDQGVLDDGVMRPGRIHPEPPLEEPGRIGAGHPVGQQEFCGVVAGRDPGRLGSGRTVNLVSGLADIVPLEVP